MKPAIRMVWSVRACAGAGVMERRVSGWVEWLAAIATVSVSACVMFFVVSMCALCMHARVTACC